MSDSATRRIDSGSPQEPFRPAVRPCMEAGAGVCPGRFPRWKPCCRNWEADLMQELDYSKYKPGSRRGLGDPETKETLREACLELRESRSEEHTSELQSRLHLVC